MEKIDEYIDKVNLVQEELMGMIVTVSFIILSGQSQCQLSMNQIEALLAPLSRMFVSFSHEYIEPTRFNDRVETLRLVKQHLDTPAAHWGSGHCSMEQALTEQTFRPC